MKVYLPISKAIVKPFTINFQKLALFTYQAQNYWKAALCLSHVFETVKLQADGHIAQFFDNVFRVSVSKLLYAAALSGRFLLAML